MSATLQSVGGVVAWRASDAPQVLEFYRRLSITAPRDLTLVAMMRHAPCARWLPTKMHGKPIIAILAAYTGRLEDAEALLARIKKFGRPIGDVLVRRPYTQMQSLLDPASWQLSADDNGSDVND